MADNSTALNQMREQKKNNNNNKKKITKPKTKLKSSQKMDQSNRRRQRQQQPCQTNYLKDIQMINQNGAQHSFVRFHFVLLLGTPSALGHSPSRRSIALNKKKYERKASENCENGAVWKGALLCSAHLHSLCLFLMWPCRWCARGYNANLINI